jgi:hypothetical protein
MDSDLWLRFSHYTRPRHISRYLSCMRYYPEQKTRALKPAGRREDEALRRREAPRLAVLPRAPLRLLAKALRVALKGLNGGYTSRVPRRVLPWLESLKVANES